MQRGLAGAAACSLIPACGAFSVLRLLQHLWRVPLKRFRLNLSPLLFLQDVDYSPTGREFVAGSYDRSGAALQRGAADGCCAPTCSSAGRPRSLPVFGGGADSGGMAAARRRGSKVAQSLSQCTRSAHLLIQRRPLARRVPHQAHAARLCCTLLGRRHLRLLRWGCRAAGGLAHGMSQSAVVWVVSKVGADMLMAQTCDRGGSSTRSSAGSLDDASKCMLPCRLR